MSEGAGDAYAPFDGDAESNVIISETVERVFGKRTYQLRLSALKGDTVCVEAELLDTGERWKGEFSAKYIEEITTKTGSYKKYSVFVKMLFSSLQENRASSSVFLDLLTYEDLESLKTRAGTTNRSTKVHPAVGNKRYIILTYAAEFDRVHYPLPLLFEDTPDAGALKATIQRLRNEVRGLKSQPNAGHSHSSSALRTEIRKLHVENAGLRTQLRNASTSSSTAHNNVRLVSEVNGMRNELKEASAQLKLMKRERDILQRRAEALEDDMERMRLMTGKELRKKEKEYEDVLQECAKYREANKELRTRNRVLSSELEAASARRPAPRQSSGQGGAIHGGRSRRTTPSITPRSSRGPSPYNSRGASPSTSRPPSRTSSRPASRTVSRPASRPTSRPPSTTTTPRKRFDPTAYVLEQRAKLEARRKRSGLSTPNTSRQNSRVPSRAPSRTVSRASSRPTSRPTSRPVSQRNSRPSSRASSGVATPSKSGASSRYRPESGRDSRGRPTRNLFNGSRSRDNSPGRVLHDVQTKLDEYVNKRGHERELYERDPRDYNTSEDDTPYASANEGGRQDEHADRLQKSPGKAALHDASAEIADIDSRLLALQSFLQNVEM